MLDKLINTFLGSRQFDPSTYAPPDHIPSPVQEHELELYKFDTCPYCQRVLRAIRELDLLEEVIFHDVRRSKESLDALIDLTGQTQVPCLVISGTPLLESKDIVMWLRAYHHHHPNLTDEA